MEFDDDVENTKQGASVPETKWIEEFYAKRDKIIGLTHDLADGKASPMLALLEAAIHDVKEHILYENLKRFSDGIKGRTE